METQTLGKDHHFHNHSAECFCSISKVAFFILFMGFSLQGDKNTFSSEQCKEIEKNNRMGKTRDLFKKFRDTRGKFRDTRGIFHAKMGSIKDRNCMDLIEAEDIKKRWQEYTEELYKKDLHDQIITMV